MASALDQKGLADVQREFSHVPPGLVEHIVRAYLSTVIPAEIAGVVEALRELAKSCGWEYGTETGNTAWHAAALIERLAASQAEPSKSPAHKAMTVKGYTIDGSTVKEVIDAAQRANGATRNDFIRLFVERGVPDGGPAYRAANSLIKRLKARGAINYAPDGSGGMFWVFRSLIDQPSTEGGKNGE